MPKTSDNFPACRAGTDAENPAQAQTLHAHGEEESESRQSQSRKGTGMSIWEAITGKYKELPEVTSDEIETLRVLNFPVGQRVDNKIALDLMNKGLVKLTAKHGCGYALTGKGMSVVAANKPARQA